MDDAQFRHLSPLPQKEESVRRGRNVIAVIGIDKYKHLQTLHNAVSDAKGVRDLFVQGLGFQELAPPLYDEQATRDAITALVVDQLSSLLEPDDSLVLFFAGHGHPETRQVGARKVQTGYLIPVEGSRPAERKFSAYLRIDAFLEDVANLPARHILVILDACHSGFALGETVEILRSPQRFSEDLSRRMSRRVITSAMADQPALDNGPVSDHSLFTGTLVEALAFGKADDENKGFVTSSELALYVQKKVASWSGSQQTPDFGYFELDERGELVIPLIGETQSRQLAQECLQIAHHVYELGRFTSDPKQFIFAAQQYRAALKHALLGKLALPAAEIGLGQALFAAGKSAEAIQVLTKLTQRTGEQAPAAAQFYLGLAYAQALDYPTAVQVLRIWLADNPDHEHTAWVEEYVQWLKRVASHQAGRRQALLIGINQYQLKSAFHLPGCINDVQQLIGLLIRQRFDFQQDDILLLTDASATRQGVLDAFATLRQHDELADAMLVYYSGHSVPSYDLLYFGQNDQDVYWILHDTQEVEGHLTNGITALELHQLMKALPAVHKTLILDTHGNRGLIDLAESDGDYNLILASDTAETAYEWHIEKEGESLPCGMLSGALYQALSEATAVQTFTYNDWVNQAAKITQAASSQVDHFQQQTPLFIGERRQPVLGRFDPYLSAFTFAQRKNWAAFSLAQLARMYNHFQAQIGAPFPHAAAAFGRAFLSKGSYQQAQAAFQRAVDQAHGLPHSLTAAQGEWMELCERLQMVSATRRQVWLFLRDVKQEDATPPNGNEQHDGEQIDAIDQQLVALKNLLKRKYGENGYEVSLFYQAEAQDQQILDKLTALAAQPGDQPAIVCIIGGPETLAGSYSERLFKEAAAAVNGKSIFLWMQRNPTRKASSR